MDVRESGHVDGVWLFPPTYALHLCEEYLAGGGFPLWAERTLLVRFSNAEFVAWNAFAFVLMCLAAWLVSRESRFRFIEIALALAVLGNVSAHLLGSLMTWTYSPGLITAVFIWMPLGAVRLRSALGASTHTARIAGACLGLAVVLATLAVVAKARSYAAELRLDHEPVECGLRRYGTWSTAIEGAETSRLRARERTSHGSAVRPGS
jgi:multisubunit Na+/H+ antiporter MnhF subunit